MTPKSSLRNRTLLAVALVLGNLAVAGGMVREARAVQPIESPCSEPGHCHCFDDGSGDPYCSHVMGDRNQSCSSGADC